jgi:hypothetical protein
MALFPSSKLRLKSVNVPNGFRNDVQPYQGCQMVYFQTKTHNSGKFWRALK